MAVDEQAMELRSAARKKSGFERWLNEPMVRMGISSIPAGDQADALKLLLESAFNAGFNSGSGDMMGSFMEIFLKGKKEDRRD